MIAMSRHLKFQFCLNLDLIHRCFWSTKLYVRSRLNFKQGNFDPVSDAWSILYNVHFLRRWKQKS